MNDKCKNNEMTDKILERIRSGYCAVLGAGISNLPLIECLYSQGADVCVRDRKPAEEHTKFHFIKSHCSAFISGEEYLSGLDSFTPPEKTVIFRSPGLRHDIREIASTVNKGAILTSEMELFFRLTKANIIAITGSDGKTTTTTLIGKLLEAESPSGKVYIGGNIGKPLLPENGRMSSKDYAVVELSSFQLQTMNISADTAVITNITPNHLNWHKDMDEYIEAKYNIFKGNGCNHLVVCADNGPALRAAYLARQEKSNINLTLFSLKSNDYLSVVPSELCSSDTAAIYERDGELIHCKNGQETHIIKSADIKLPGRHNVLNYMAAIAATWGMVDLKTVKKLATEFAGVEHRIELVREKDGVKYYNSSIDSTPTRTAAALSSFSQKLIVICGGRNKNLSFDPLAKILCKRAKAVVLTGESADEIMESINNCTDCERKDLRIEICKDFEDAIVMAKDIAESGDIVILSPACTSFDRFDNFEERGNLFKKIVNSF